MTNSSQNVLTYVHYVGITVPHCSLTYGLAPCAAQLTRFDGSQPNLVNFNGAYARRVGSYTGAADSKLLTGSFWFTATDAFNDTEIIGATTTLAGSTWRFFIDLSTNVIEIVGYAAGTGTETMRVQTSATITENKMYHILFSFDLSSVSKRHLYVDDVSDLNVTTYNNNNMDFTLGDWAYAAGPNGTFKFAGSIAEFWMAPGVYIDFSVEANRRLFIDSYGRPVALGATGQLPTGTAPRFYFPNAAASFHTNAGTGGGFTVQASGSEADGDFATSTDKCFNSLGSCQDIANFDNDGGVVVFFGEDVPNYQAFSTPVFPFIKSISFQSAIVSLGDDMGQRGSVTVKLRDAPHNDTPGSYFDKYSTTRDLYDSDDMLASGTFWGKFRARNPYMRFQTLYLYSTAKDADGNDLDSTIRTYLIESISGPDINGEVSIIAKDALKVTDEEFAQAPLQSPGFLALAIDESETELVISPSGILAEYPSNFYACVGGNEVINCSKTGGDGIHVDRGQLGTIGQTHSAQDRLQIVLRYDAESPDVIIADLLETYGGVDGGLIDSDAWAAEIAAQLNTVYTFTITEPTGVKDLVSEIIQQIGGAIWWDDINGQIRLQILKAVATDADRFNEDNVIANSLQVQEQENKRVTEVDVYFGQLDPTMKVDETRNYASVATVSDETTQALVGGKNIKTIFARGIAGGGRTVAERLAQKYLSRYVQPPRRFNFDLLRASGPNPILGGGYLLGGGDLQWGLGNSGGRSWPLQDAFGARVEAPIQVTRVNPVGNTIQVEAEEMLFTAYGADIDPTNHTIIFDVSRNNVNLEDVHNSVYAVAVSGDTVNCIISSGVIIGSTDTGTPGFIVGSFAGGVTVNIINGGYIQGAGGNGGSTGSPNGEAGGTALYTRRAINMDNNGQIWGGGGGGGAAVQPAGTFAGGGGAGTIVGAAGTGSGSSPAPHDGSPGTQSAGGASAPTVGSVNAGDGGNPGQAGANSTGATVTNGTGGAAGNAVDGNSFVTYSATGDRQGPLIN